ncbi:condensation domain-containing protein [Kitasatospora sp. NBC_01560]|uniref:condensation domain-containing protein n=1 Tax=Kitasatospora sp. NBC_01560 TaxID=2975965 RepID=UPI0038668F86
MPPGPAATAGSPATAGSRPTEDWKRLVRLLDEREIVLSTEGDRLEYLAPPGAMDAHLVALIKGERQRLLAALTGDGAAEASAPAGIAQARMHRSHGRVVDPSLWNITQRITLRGPLDPDRLQRALTALTARHRSLRTRYTPTDLGLLQQVLPAPAALPLPVAAVGDAVGDAGEAVAAATREEAATPFDLGAPPLLRARLLRLAPDHHVLLLTIHHIVLDGWSLATLLADLGTLYGDHLAVLPEPGSMIEHACWERTVVTREAVRRATARYAERLAGLPLTVPLPTDRPRPERRSGHGGVLRFELTPELTAALNRCAARRSTTPAAVVLAALGDLLGELTGDDESLVMLSTANRRRREHERLVGLLTTNLPVRLPNRAPGGFAALIDRAAEALASTLDRADVPFGLLTEDLRALGLALPPSFPQVMLVVQSTPAPVLELTGLDVLVEDVPGSSARSDLLLMLTPEGRGLAGLAEYDADLFDEATVRGWIDGLVRRLAEQVPPLA